jgi:hypothetical protein
LTGEQLCPAVTSSWKQQSGHSRLVSTAICQWVSRFVLEILNSYYFLEIFRRAVFLGITGQHASFGAQFWNQYILSMTCNYESDVNSMWQVGAGGRMLKIASQQNRDMVYVRQG